MGLKWQWWMYAFAAAALLTVILLGVWVSWRLKKFKARALPEASEE